MRLVASRRRTDQRNVDLPRLALWQAEAQRGVGDSRVAQVCLVPTAELEPVVVRTDGSRSDDQRTRLTAGLEGYAQAAGLLLHDLPRRWRPDEHPDDAEEQRDDDRFRDQRTDQVIAPPLHLLLGLGGA
jgi:hypothetical protein